jgi:accessory gene regulator protein AgrB
MDLGTKVAIVTGLFSLTVMINLTFGFLRNKTRKFSLKWFLSIHLPIPLIFLARVSSHLDFRYIPVFVVAALTGQIVGGKIEF